MNNIIKIPAMLTIAVLLGACSTTPTSTSLLEQTRHDYIRAQNNPKVATYAPVEMKQAGDALERANAAAADKDSIEKVDKLAYLAKQKIALTEEVAKQKSAEAEIASSGKERDQIRLDQRTNEANQAKVAAEQSRLSAQIARDNEAEAQRKTQEAQARSAQLEAQLAALAAKKTERGMIITLGDVLFGTDLSQLTPDGMGKAERLANVLKQNPELTVSVEGFADSTGTAVYNQELSERRATAVRSALESMGVTRDRIAVRGYGEAYPVVANDSNQHRQMNRRVEIIVSDASGKINQR